MKSKSITQLATGLTLWVWLGLLSSAQAQLTAIAEQDFSGDFSSGWAFTPDPATYNTGSDIWDTVSALSSINPVVGTYFWGMQDLDNPNGGGAFWHTLTFTPQDIAGFPNPEVHFDYYSIGYDTSDELAYVIEYDNGDTWGTEVALEKNTEAWTTVSIVVPPGSDWVRIRLQAFQNGGSDYAAFDNVRVVNNEAGDTTPPEVVEGGFLTPTDFYIVYSEPVTDASSTNASNYSVTPGQTVTSLTLSATMDTVFGVVTPGLDYGTLYTADISGVVDTSSNANPMIPFNVEFFFNDYAGDDIIFTELYYFQPDGGIQNLDYFELYNKGDVAIELAGMQITTGINHEFDASYVLNAGEYLVLCEDLTAFNTAFPSVTNVIQWESGGLSGGGEAIEMYNTPGDLVTMVDYETSAPWPMFSDSVASELCDLATDHTDGNNWRHAAQVSSTVSATLYGSPGSANMCVEEQLPTDVATIADLRAGSTDGTEYRLTGEAILTYQQSFRGQKFIQDATAGILIDDDGGVITTEYAINDGITNLTGTLSEFGGMLQFVPVEDPGAATSSDNEVTPVEVTLNDLATNFEDYESILVKVLGVSFDDAGGTFSNGSVYPTSDLSGTFNFRTTFFNVDYIDTEIPTSADIVAIPNSRNDGSYYTARNLADILTTPDNTAEVTFRVNVSLETGFDANLGVNLMGIDANWGLGDSMADPEGDLIYELTLTLEAGDYEYKFRNGNDDNVGGLEWEDLPGGGNRNLTVVAGMDTILPAYCWGSFEPCAEQPSSITFKVDVSEAGLDLSQGINLMGTATDWDSGQPMDDTDGDLIYELTLELQPNTYEYKFRTGTGVWEDIGNRTLVVVEGEDQVLPAVCWNSNDVCNPVVFNVETFTNSNATSSYADGSYVGDNGITWNYIQSRDDNGDANGSGIDVPALMLRRVDDGSAVFSESIAGGVGDFSIKLYKGFTGGGDRQVEVFVNGISIGSSEPFDDFDLHVFEVQGVNIAGDVVIRIENITPKQVIVDDISWTGYEGDVLPIVAINTPVEGETYETEDVQFEFVVQNYVIGVEDIPESQGYAQLTVDGVFLMDFTSVVPIEITGLTDGPHQAIIELIDYEGADLGPQSKDTVNFTVELPTIVQVSSMADLRAGMQDGTVYELTGEAVVTYAQSFRGQKYLQDGTAGILIDDPDGVITSEYMAGDGMTGLKGTLSEFSGMTQLTPFEDPGSPSSTGNAVEPVTVSLADLNASFDDYESELVYVAGVDFGDNAGGLFENGTNYTIDQDGVEGIFRTHFFFVDYIETEIPQQANITALAIEFNGTAQIVARNAADFDIIDAIADEDKAAFSVYPNPTQGVVTLTNANAHGSYIIELLDVTGKAVYAESLGMNAGQSIELDFDQQTPGLYLLKLTSKEQQQVQTIRVLIE